MRIAGSTSIVIGLSLLLGACSSTVPRDHIENASAAALSRTLVSHSLRRFRSAAEFDTYRRRVDEAADQRAARYPWSGTVQKDLLASTDDAEPLPVCDPAVQSCGQLEEIQVTGSRISKPSITNNQEAGVDEGDIVKQYGRFLIVLHDGRLFSVDTGETSGALALVDRVNVYRDAKRGTWYDELLISDDHLVVTGYDYREGASELAIFRINADGVMTFEATYNITSDDYYSAENYASRLVDGHLVLYTPLRLSDFDADKPVEFPRVRRWTEAQGFSEWEPLFGPTDIYLPIQQTLDPTVHTLSVCPLSGPFRCRSTGIIGPREREFYVSPEYAYMWVSSSVYDTYSRRISDCAPGRTSSDFAALPAAVYRLPLFGGSAKAVLAAGTPNDQFSLDARDNEFLALLWWQPSDCYTTEPSPLRYARIPADAFSLRPQVLGAERYTAMPTPGGEGIENRFTERYLVYGGSQGYWSAFYSLGRYQPTSLVAVPVDDPSSLKVLPLAHSAERVETFGENIVVDGYQHDGGLWVSSLDLATVPRIADVEYLDRVLESEGRSHAFNALVENDGSGLFGLPTVFKQSTWKGEIGSNVHFFAVDASLDIQPAGYLQPAENPVDADYKCEVSCVDWYGNARPIFTDGRVFALTGTELIEGYFVSGLIRERQRVNLTGIPLNRR